MPRRREAHPHPTRLEEVPEMGILFSDLVDARGVPDATLLLQFTYIGGRTPTGIHIIQNVKISNHPNSLYLVFKHGRGSQVQNFIFGNEVFFYLRVVGALWG